MKGDNRGMTLVELMVAVTMSVIITGAAGLFIQNALKGYQSASSAVDFQMESQVLMEQLGTWIMEGNRVEIASCTDPDGTARNVLVIYSIPAAQKEFSDAEFNSPQTFSRRFIWQRENALYMKKIDGIDLADLEAPGDLDTAGMDYDLDARRDSCVSESIKAFTPAYDRSADPAADPEIVKISLTLSRGAQEYEVNDEFQIRNELR